MKDSYARIVARIEGAAVSRLTQIADPELLALDSRADRLDEVQQQIITAYQKMSEHTKAKCGASQCLGMNNRPTRCCEQMYCHIALEFAEEEWGILLNTPGDRELPLMGKNGCTAPPHLRPMCTLHQCAINSVAATGDAEWDNEYFRIRDKIEGLESLVSHMWPKKTETT